MATKMKNGDDEAFNYLFRSKLRFIVSVPNRYEGFGSSLKELINTRSIGLIHSIRNFNLKRGFKLIIYSVRWIRQCIIRDIAVHRGAVRIPIKKVALMHKITATHRTLPQEFGREISAEELAEKVLKSPPLATRAAVKLTRRQWVQTGADADMQMLPLKLHLTEDFKEASQSFVEKRAPEYHAR